MMTSNIRSQIIVKSTVWAHVYKKRTASDTQFTFSFLFREAVNPDFTVLLGLHKKVSHCVTGLCNLRLMPNGCLQRHILISVA